MVNIFIKIKKNFLEIYLEICKNLCYTFVELNKSHKVSIVPQRVLYQGIIGEKGTG